ncbi:MAG: hypothetical protein JRN06_03075 [Nitrososphaerota archaeon]|nr:hypothetical protein [Nitrososphaerota archaeon]MDG7023159.1 hypothetical protein [Nitrososphaerota archaeon]
MASFLQPVAEPLVYLAALAITLASGTLVYRQRLTAYHVVRSFVLGVYVLITFMMLLDLYRVTLGTVGFIPAFAGVSIGLGLLQCVLLLAAAQVVYLSPTATYRDFGSVLAKRRGHAALLVAFIALAAFAEIYAAFVSPVSSGLVTDFAGNKVPSMRVGADLIPLVIGLFSFFLVYPTALMLLGSSKVKESRLRSSIVGLALGWATVSAIYVFAEVYAWDLKVDATGLMYLANAVIFYVVIRNFRRSASLAGFVEHGVPVPTRGTAPNESMSPLTGALAGKKLLYEVDPSLSYDRSLRQTLEELAWAGHAVFVFTPKSSPLHNTLSGGTGLKFFLSSLGISYVKVSEKTGEVLIPQSDTAVILDVADKTLGSRGGKVVFVFDSVTDMLLSAGLEKTYKFLKQFLELLHEPRSTGFFVFIKVAHGDREVNLLRGIFPNIYLEDKEGSRIIK